MKTIVALYDHLNDANDTVRDLINFGISRDEISLVATDASGNYSSYLSTTGGEVATSTTMDNTSAGMATGAGIGAIVGGLGGLLVGLGVLTIPGIGPVLAAGPLAAAISALTGTAVGAVAGGATGGILGALVDMGLPEEQAGYYAEGIRRGGVLVTARVQDQHASQVQQIMNRHNVVNIEQRVSGWRREGWQRYDPNSPVVSTQSDERFNRFTSDFEQHFNTTYPTRGHTFDFYRPAYYYGYQLANDPRYRDWTWDDIEPEARRDWSTRYSGQGFWEDFRDAVQYSWMRVKQGVKEAFD